MIKLDKIKIISSIKNISNINDEKFQCIVKEGEIKEQKIKIKTPHLLEIRANYQEKELTIEFTSKILKDDCIQLINKNNIQQCLTNINQFGICTLNVEGIIADGDVVKCDVSKDVDCQDCKSLTKQLRSGVTNFQKYLPRIIGGNFVIEKNVTTKGLKKRLTIYDKGSEILLATNREFLASVKDKGAILDYFTGKVRFELNLNSKEQIRQSLGILDTSIQSVLGTTSTPIWDFLDKVLDDGEGIRSCSSLNELKNQLLLEHCGKDLAKVETLLREYYSPNTHISHTMKQFRALLTKMSADTPSNVKEQLRNLLVEIVILIGIVSI